VKFLRPNAFQLLPVFQGTTEKIPMQKKGGRKGGYTHAAMGVAVAIYGSYAFWKFMRIHFLEVSIPDAVTLLYFRHLLEENGLNKLFSKRQCHVVSH